jgi:hypothetical protein
VRAIARKPNQGTHVIEATGLGHCGLDQFPGVSGGLAEANDMKPGADGGDSLDPFGG